MGKLKVYDVNGAAIGDYDVSDELLVLDRGRQAVHDVVVGNLNARRAGTASTLSKGEVRGTGSKPWRQKGTGRARAGYRQSPVWRGGAVAFGPRPRSYAVKVNKKVAKLAFRRAFSERVAEDSIRVVEELSLPEPKTRLFAQMLKAMQIKGSVLFVDAEISENVGRASRNVPRVDVVRAKDVGARSLLNSTVVVVTRAGMDVLLSRMGAASKEAA